MSRKSILTQAITPPLYLVVTIVLLLINSAGSSVGLEYGNYAPLYYVQGVVGSLFVVSICEPFEGRFGRTWPVIATMGGATIVLLLFQFPFLMVSKIAYRVLFHPTHTAPYFSVIGGIAFTLIILAAMYPCILLINRYAPILNGVWKRK